MFRFPKDLVRDFVIEGDFKSIKDIENASKDIFKDTIQNGTSTRDISFRVQEICGVDFSPKSVRRITDKLISLYLS